MKLFKKERRKFSGGDCGEKVEQTNFPFDHWDRFSNRNFFNII